MILFDFQFALISRMFETECCFVIDLFESYNHSESAYNHSESVPLRTLSGNYSVFQFIHLSCSHVVKRSMFKPHTVGSGTKL